MSNKIESAATLRQRLRAALPAAMRAKDRVAVTALRSALAAIDNAEAADVAQADGMSLAIEQSPIGVGAAEVARRDLTTTDIERIVREEIATREEAAAGYEKAGRDDHAARLRDEAAVLERHLAA